MRLPFLIVFGSCLLFATFEVADSQLTFGTNGLRLPPINLLSVYRILKRTWKVLTGTSKPQVKKLKKEGKTSDATSVQGSVQLEKEEANAELGKEIRLPKNERFVLDGLEEKISLWCEDENLDCSEKTLVDFLQDKNEILTEEEITFILDYNNTETFEKPIKELTTNISDSENETDASNYGINNSTSLEKSSNLSSNAEGFQKPMNELTIAVTDTGHDTVADNPGMDDSTSQEKSPNLSTNTETLQNTIIIELPKTVPKTGHDTDADSPGKDSSSSLEKSPKISSNTKKLQKPVNEFTKTIISSSSSSLPGSHKPSSPDNINDTAADSPGIDNATSIEKSPKLSPNFLPFPFASGAWIGYYIALNAVLLGLYLFLAGPYFLTGRTVHIFGYEEPQDSYTFYDMNATMSSLMENGYGEDDDDDDDDDEEDDGEDDDNKEDDGEDDDNKEGYGKDENGENDDEEDENEENDDEEDENEENDDEEGYREEKDDDNGNDDNGRKEDEEEEEQYMGYTTYGESDMIMHYMMADDDDDENENEDDNGAMHNNMNRPTNGFRRDENENEDDNDAMHNNMTRPTYGFRRDEDTECMENIMCLKPVYGARALSATSLALKLLEWIPGISNFGSKFKKNRNRLGDAVARGRYGNCLDYVCPKYKRRK